MTERAFSAPRAADAAVPRATSRTAATTPALTTPLRAALLLGASGMAYAVALAGVSAWQAETSAATAAVHATGLDAVASARAANDGLGATVDRLDADTRALLDGYDDATRQTADYQQHLDDLAALVADVEGTVARLPARIPLPAVTVHGSIPRAGGSGAPATKARTGASGG